MASKRDQLQAYQFLVQRAISALVTRETDPEQPPFRRPAGASFASIAVAVVALACVGVYGLIVPGGNVGWRSGDSVIVEKETGTRYVYLDGRLHPVTNYTSALLLIGDHAETRLVSRDSLVDVPRGPRIGIADAPDALPGADRVLSGGWSLCSTPAVDAAGARVEESTLLVGASPAGGTLLGDSALLVELAGSADRFVVWRGYRHKIVDYAVVGTGLALTSEPWARVSQAWLDMLPEGAPIGPIALADFGAPSVAVPGRGDLKVGSLLAVGTSGGETQYYLAEKEVLRPLTALQFDVQRAVRGSGPFPVTPAAAAAARRLDPAAGRASDAPAARPRIASVRDRGVVCATFSSGDVAVVLEPGVPGGMRTGGRTERGVPLADQVFVPPGWVAVVEAMPSAESRSGTLTVVTDMGRRYPVGASSVLKMLGYEGVPVVRLPASLVARVPEGPGLDPLAALRQP
ncbi:type VII secretion protein EccB [Actinokineospora sp. HUAS TT18]|uniref:type VII secretion protein EccB n=1 Tax=Actinokineospora sp. HUAS TT18 TaxID=3447451 RepID=UPI003F52517F